MARFACLCYLAVFVAADTRAQETSDKDVAALIRQLGSARYAERERAMQALERTGTRAIPALEKALDGTPEVRRRAKTLIEKIEQRNLQATVRQPRKVRWDLRDRSILEVLEEAHKTWGIAHELKLDRALLARTKITLKTDELPFWEAWELFTRRAGLSELVQAPLYTPAQRIPAGPAQGGVPPRAGFSSQAFQPDASPWAKWLVADKQARETPILIHAAAPRWAMDASGSVRVRALPIQPGHRWTVGSEPPTLLLEMRPQPGLGWLSLESIRFDSLVTATGEKRTVSEALQKKHDATVTKGRGNWGHLIERMAGGEQVPWPYDSIFLELPGEKTAWKEVRGTLRAKVFRSRSEPCLKDVAHGDETEWKNGNGVRGRVLSRRVTDDGRLCLQLRLDDSDSWVADYPGPGVRRIRPGVVVFLGPGDIAADLLRVHDARGRPLRRIHVGSSQSEDGKGLELDLQYEIELGADETFRLEMLRHHASIIEFPFRLTDLSCEP